MLKGSCHFCMQSIYWLPLKFLSSLTTDNQILRIKTNIKVKDHLRFFVQVGHEIIIFLLYISCHTPSKIINNLLKDHKILIFIVIFQCWKSVKSFWSFFYGHYNNRRATFINKIFWNFWFSKNFIFLNMCLIFVCSVLNFGLVTWHSEKLIISTVFLCGFMSSLLKNSWTDSNVNGGIKKIKN